MLQGYKTYIVVLMVVAIAVCEGILGIDIPGAEMQQDWVNYVLGALGFAGLRAGVGK